MNFTTTPDETGQLTVAGCSIAYAAWGGSDDVALPILLIHGAGAQMGWWDGVISRLAAFHHVLAFDLSGNGDSGWREAYRGEQWADEVVAVARELWGGPALAVGHSLGGRVAIIAAARDPDTVLGPVLVDAPLRRPGMTLSLQSAIGKPRVYESLELALESFHLRPNEPVVDRELLLRVAANSYRRVDGGWRPKADSRIYGRIDDSDLAAYLATISAPLTFVYGDRSAVVNEASLELLVETYSGPTELVPIKGGFHHLTFDHAAEVADAIKTAWGAVSRALA